MTRKMKDSGVEWIGEIPEDWDSVSLSRVLKSSITDGPHETPEYVDDGIPFISVDSLGFGEKANLDIVKRYITQEDYELFNKKTNLETGDILFTKAATIGKLAIKDDRKYMVWSPIAVIKPNDQIIESEFLYNVFSSNKYISHVILLGTSNTQINVGMGTLEKSKIPVPPKPQQKAIANFLDEKTQEIDNIISKTKKSIDQYKKYKQSLITETVTKGLDENVEMKDSGIEWIGEIPEHWDVVRLKYLVDLTMGQSPNSESYNKDQIGIEFLQGNKDFGQIYPKATEYTINPKKISSKDDILFSVRAPVGARNISDKEYAIGRGLCSLTAVGLNKKYLWYWMNLLNVALKIHMRGSTYDSVTIDDINNSFLLKLPTEEQKQIAAYLDQKCSQVDQIISSKEKLLIEMEAYKKSLIYETVTGKREVE